MRSKPSARCLTDMPVTTVDLGNAIAAELANGDLVKGVAAQRPFDLGVAAAITALMSLIGRHPPPWIVTPGIPVTRDNLAEAHQAIWPAPPHPSIRLMWSAR